ncbi:MAG: type IX secretion system membrane protein PorP/SprF [Sphingobacteriaceae bacterium]|nr:type IX secretion system membrane protein PorP/SprF [Sphingobacteriaceae bacterium]
MKRGIALLIISLVVGASLQAQQKPHYTQYMQNMSVLNPAVTGMYHELTIRSGYRTQWVGLESAPKTSYFTISKPINIGNTRSGNVDYGINDPATKSDKSGYFSSLSHHGIGLVALNDETGPITRTTLNFTYAYHINISDAANLAVGVGAGVNRVSLNTSKLRFEDSNEPVIASGGNLTRWSPDLNAGIYFYSASVFVGGVIQQALNQRLSFAENYESGKEVPHFFITTGCRLWVREDFSIFPSVTLKQLKPLPMAYDVNVKVAYRNNLWIGSSFRKGDSYSAMFGFNVAKSVSLGYAFDNTFSKLRDVNTGSHEIVLGINF